MTAPTTPTSPTAPAAAGPPPRPAPAPWGAGRTVLVVFGALAALAGLTLLLVGGVLSATAAGGRENGYFSAGDAPLHSDGYAVSVQDIGVDVRGPDVAAARDMLGRVRIEATGTSGDEIFIGIAPSADVDRYLTGVQNDEVLDFDVDPFDATYLPHEGGAPATRPDQQNFWTASDAGTGTREILWNATPGEWSVVIMNADGGQGVDASVGIGATLPVLRIVAVTLVVLGISALLTGAVLVALAFGTRSHSPYVAVPVTPSR